MQTTSIEWSDFTWNPTRGCSRVSPGCEHCYAELIAARFSGPGQPFELFADRNKSASKWTGLVQLKESKLLEPFSWDETPRRVFVNSMSDLFHEGLPEWAIDVVFAVMALTPHLTYQILTKRAHRMREYVSGANRFAVIDLAAGVMALAGRAGKNPIRPTVWPLPNVWLGVSVEDTARRFRVEELLQTPAALRFVSYEPALEWVDFKPYLGLGGCFVRPRCGGAARPPAKIKRVEDVPRVSDCVTLDWGIIGGESGPGARPFDLKWALDTVESFGAAGVPLFVKQFGARPYDTRPHGLGSWEIAGTPKFLSLKDPKGGDWDEWPAAARVRQFPAGKPLPAG